MAYLVFVTMPTETNGNSTLLSISAPRNDTLYLRKCKIVFIEEIKNYVNGLFEKKKC